MMQAVEKATNASSNASDSSLKQKVLKYVNMLGCDSLVKKEDALSRLEALSTITLELLSETGVGKAVNGLRRHPNFADRAQVLVTKWRDQAKNQALADGHIVVDKKDRIKNEVKVGEDEKTNLEELPDSEKDKVNDSKRTAHSSPSTGKKSQEDESTTKLHRIKVEPVDGLQHEREPKLKHSSETKKKTRDEKGSDCSQQQQRFVPNDNALSSHRPATDADDEEQQRRLTLKIRLPAVASEGAISGKGNKADRRNAVEGDVEQKLHTSNKRAKIKTEPVSFASEEGVETLKHKSAKSRDKNELSSNSDITNNKQAASFVAKRVKSEPAHMYDDTQQKIGGDFSRFSSAFTNYDDEDSNNATIVSNEDEDWATVLSRCGESDGYIEESSPLTSMQTSKNASYLSDRSQKHKMGTSDGSILSNKRPAVFHEKVKRNLPEITDSDVDYSNSSISTSSSYASKPYSMSNSVLNDSIHHSSNSDIGNFLDPTIARSKTRTQLYAGRKKKNRPVYSGSNKSGAVFTTSIPTLFEICIRTASQNIEVAADIVFPRYIPFYVMRPILERCTYAQLKRIERKNPYLCEDTAELWKRHCEREFPNQIADFSEHDEEGSDGEQRANWRRRFKALVSDRDRRLASISARIHSNTAIAAAPQRVTKEIVALTPRFARRRQKLNGLTTSYSKDLPSAAELSRSRRQIFETGDKSGIRLHARLDQQPTTSRKPVAPLMAKTLKMVKGMRR